MCCIYIYIYTCVYLYIYIYILKYIRRPLWGQPGAEAAFVITDPLFKVFRYYKYLLLGSLLLGSLVLGW